MPASLTVTVSFPASFLLNTKRTLLAFPITDAPGSMQQEINYGTSIFISEPHITPDGFSPYSNVLSPRSRSRSFHEIKTCRLSPLQDGSSLQQSSLISAPETRLRHAAIQIRSNTDGNTGKNVIFKRRVLEEGGKVLASRPVEDECAAETLRPVWKAVTWCFCLAFSFDLERQNLSLSSSHFGISKRCIQVYELHTCANIQLYAEITKSIIDIHCKFFGTGLKKSSWNQKPKWIVNQFKITLLP